MHSFRSLRVTFGDGYPGRGDSGTMLKFFFFFFGHDRAFKVEKNVIFPKHKTPKHCMTSGSLDQSGHKLEASTKTKQKVLQPVFVCVLKHPEYAM